MDQFVRRWYLKERFSDSSPEKRPNVIGDASPSAIQWCPNWGIFLDQTLYNNKRPLFLTQILFEAVLEVERHPKKKLRATQDLGYTLHG
jgi:hypothetical protein